jgi:hypothetical protein
MSSVTFIASALLFLVSLSQSYLITRDSYPTAGIVCGILSVLLFGVCGATHLTHKTGVVIYGRRTVVVDLKPVDTFVTRVNEALEVCGLVEVASDMRDVPL